MFLQKFNEIYFQNQLTILMEINEMIGREMHRQHLSKADMAKKLNNHPTTVNLLLQNKDIRVSRLIQISEVLQYNFIHEIAVSLPYKEPNYEVKIDLDAIKAPLLEKIKNLELEVSILRQTLKDITSK